ncbi:hypothetical protein LLH23_05215 [bacterium]|nr:hypothetical protein [bacterium]
MRRLSVLLLLPGLLWATACGAQEADRGQLLTGIVRLIDIWTDIEILGRLTQLALTDAQWQTVAAVHQAHPPPGPDLQVVAEAADKAEELRRKVLAGQEMKPGDQEALGRLMQTAVQQLGDRGLPDGKPITELTAEEKLVWAVLTPEQQGKLIGGGQPDAIGRRGLALLKRLRDTDEATWAQSRDRLVALLSAQAGGEGTAARENSRQMLLDFLNRVRAMPATDFAKRQTELMAEIGVLVPQNANLAALLLEFDPTPIHQALSQTLLNSRMPRLLQEMHAVRARPAGG